MSHANRNQLWSRILIGELARSGVRHVCIAPGSRSTPLVLACAENPSVEISVHLDERSAAFFALGWGKGAGAPAAVVTTSGTAAANLLPAVVEASQSEVPLLILTADRPPHLRGADANQAIDQIRIFGGYPRAFHDVELPRVHPASLRHLRSVASRAVADAVGAPPGPVHLNLPFEKPLEPTEMPGEVPADLEEEHPRAVRGRTGPTGRDGQVMTGGEADPYTRIHRRRSQPPREAVRAVADLFSGAGGVGRKGVIVAGPSAEPDRTGSAVLKLASVAGIPLLADPISGARFRSGPDAAKTSFHDFILREQTAVKALRPDFILRIGSSPSSASLCAFMAEHGVSRQVVVDDGHRYKDHLAAAHEYVRADPALFVEGVIEEIAGADSEIAEDVDEEIEGWANRWLALDRLVGKVVEETMAGDFFEGHVLREVIASAPDGAVVFASNSMPIRDLDSFGGSVGERSLAVHGNRGASGIDGIVSTALGLARGTSRPVTAVLGDLALYHDMNGLLAARGGGPPVTFVVINNDGGGIFHMLPIREWDPPFTELFATPHGLHFSRAAELYGLSHVRVSGPEELRVALSEQGDPGEHDDSSSRIVEVTTDREENRRRHQEVETAVRSALRTELGDGE